MPTEKKHKRSTLEVHETSLENLRNVRKNVYTKSLKCLYKSVSSLVLFQELHNFPLPEWISDSVWTRLRNILERDRMMTDKDPKLNFLKGGGG